MYHCNSETSIVTFLIIIIFLAFDIVSCFLLKTQLFELLLKGMKIGNFVILNNSFFLKENSSPSNKKLFE